MECADFYRHAEMKMCMHHVYEFHKGIRSLVLCTLERSCAELLKERLDAQGIGYLVQPVAGGDKVNLYFGKSACLDVVQTFIDKPLNRLSPEQDFMLGSMLGYAVEQQCERYCKRRAAVIGCEIALHGSCEGGSSMRSSRAAFLPDTE